MKYNQKLKCPHSEDEDSVAMICVCDLLCQTMHCQKVETKLKSKVLDLRRLLTLK